MRVYTKEHQLRYGSIFNTIISHMWFSLTQHKHYGQHCIKVYTNVFQRHSTRYPLGYVLKNMLLHTTNDNLTKIYGFFSSEKSLY